MDKIKFPTDIKSVKLFEKNKHLNKRINIYSWERVNMLTDSIFPIHISKTKALHTIKLFFHDNHYYYSVSVWLLIYALLRILNDHKLFWQTF